MAEPDATSGTPVSVLLVCRSYPPILGGSEIEAQRVCAALRGRGHRVQVIAGGGDGMPCLRNWKDPYGTPVRLYGEVSGRWAGYRYALGVAFSIWKERRKYDLVYFLMPGIQILLGVPVAHALGKGVVMKFSGSNEVRKMGGSRLGRWQVAVLRRCAYRIMVLNPGMREEAREAGFPPEQLLWMPNPVDTAIFAPADEAERKRLRQKLGVPPDRNVAVFIGRLAPEKELPYLLKGFALAASQQPGSMLVLVGGGPLRDELEELAGDLGLREHVRFTGPVATEQVPEWLRAADVFALVSSLEGLPVSLLEAMATGLPAVSSDIPAMTQMITHETHGLVTRLRDEGSIGEALARLFQEPELRQRLGAAARAAAVSVYSTERVVERYEALFREWPGLGPQHVAC